MIHALLLRAPAGAAITSPRLLRTQPVAASAPLRVSITARPARAPSPSGTRHQTDSGYKPMRG